jgi:hypothetical protein
MNQQKDVEISNPQTPIEDLPVNQDQATEVKAAVGGWGASAYQWGNPEPPIRP